MPYMTAALTSILAFAGYAPELPNTKAVDPHKSSMRQQKGLRFAPGALGFGRLGCMARIVLKHWRLGIYLRLF